MGALKPWHIATLFCDVVVTVALIVGIVVLVRVLAKRKGQNG